MGYQEEIEAELAQQAERLGRRAARDISAAYKKMQIGAAAKGVLDSAFGIRFKRTGKKRVYVKAASTGHVGQIRHHLVEQLKKLGVEVDFGNTWPH